MYILVSRAFLWLLVSCLAMGLYCDVPACGGGGRRAGGGGGGGGGECKKGELVMLAVILLMSLRLGRNLDGRVQITHLADGFVKEYKSLYSVGDLVTAKIIKYVGQRSPVHVGGGWS